MATISFTSPKPETPKPAEPAFPQAITAPPEAGPLEQWSPQLEGQFGPSDLATPFLTLCQKSGLLTDEHPDWVGKFVYDKTTCLGPEINAIFFRLRKFYEEETEFGGPNIPQRFDRIESARAKDVQVREAAEADLVVVLPSDKAPGFSIPIAEFALVPCRYMVRGTAYPRLVGTLLKDLSGWLAKDLTSGAYKITTERRQSGTNSWFVPRLAAAGKTPAAVRSTILEKLMSGGS